MKIYISKLIRNIVRDEFRAQSNTSLVSRSLTEKMDPMIRTAAVVSIGTALDTPRKAPKVKIPQMAAKRLMALKNP